MTREEAEYVARVATARGLNVPLWVVDMNLICLEKDVEWFEVYRLFLLDDGHVDDGCWQGG